MGCFDDKNRKYRMEPDEEFSEDSLREFVENFKEGKLRTVDPFFLRLFVNRARHFSLTTFFLRNVD